MHFPKTRHQNFEGDRCHSLILENEEEGEEKRETRKREKRTISEIFDSPRLNCKEDRETEE
jgi:hypothetical protein